ncbi:uncharacterized protein LOC108272987 isoform X3 [Ictalurus punctatus]|uniref:Uncharacterized protein LOC108272987 isoform X3 n=1 Tax=Ictalurus punctatus TaxID=7998 RepID=A0A9F7RGS9_ICTPU|nr:uncharacterized protein LOC108272987 isoform X3 [Ictalurus punctatus]
MASSHQSAREYIRDACENLLGRLQNLPLIVEKLHQQNVLNGNEVGDLEDEPVNCRKTRKILDWVINKGEEACYKFLRILDRERKSVLPKLDSSSLTPDLHTWICLFSFRDEPEDDYTQGPSSCHQLQKILKTRTKESLGEQWRQSQQFYGGKVQENFTFIPLVLDTDTEKNTPHNKIILKSKKSKKSRSKKLRAYIPRDTQRKSPEDLLNSEEKSILIVGKPGIGKTTVVQQMLHHWAERHDPNLDFMFYFDENTLSNTSTTVSLEHLLLSKVLMSNPQLKDNAEEILHYLQEYSERVTIVFDGIRDFPDNAFFLGIIQHDLLPEAKVVATCRPEVEYKFSDWTTCKVYVQGFSEESIYDFFRKMSGNDPEMVDSVINNPALFSLCHVPMYAFMVAACILNDTSEKAQKQCTASELYVQIFCDCLQRHGKKKLLHLDGHIKNCRDKVLSLAESAFNATKLKTIILEFDYYEKDIAGAFLKTVSVMSPARAKTFCAFPHNTMQEFFSALWLLEKTEIVDELLHLCQNEDSKHMKHVIPFLCGLQSHTNIDHLKCLFPLNKVMENIDSFFEKVLNTFLCDQPDDEKVDVAFICQCLYEYQSPETCCSFLERINYYLDLSEEHLDPYTCCAVSYVISQSRNKRVHLDLENSAVSLSGLKTVLDHSQYLRDLSATLCQVWTITLKCEELNYLIHLLQLCGNEIHIPVSSQTDVLRQAGKIITQYAEQTNLHLHCDKDSRQFSDLLCSTVFTWLPHISSLQFDSKQGEKEREERCRTFLLDLCLQAALHQPHNIQETVEKMMTIYYKEQSDFLLDLYSRVKQYESETGRRVLPALLPVYQSGPAVWYINLSERKVSLLLEVLKLQTEKKPVVLRDCSDEESEVRSFLQCLPYISHLRFKRFYSDSESTASIQFLLNLSIAAVDCKSDKGESFTELLASVCSYNTFPFGEEFHGFQEEQSDFLLDLYSRVKLYKSKTGRRVLPALLPVYQSVPAVWSINLSERKVSLLLEVLKLQTEKKPVVLRDWSDEKSEVRSFLQCLPYISHLRFDSKQGEKEREERCRTFLLDLCLQAALHQPHNIQETVEKVMTFYYKEQSDFLLDLYSRVKQYESETGRRVLPALLPVYQSGPAVWYIKLSERRVSLLLEVLKLQTEKKPVELRDCSDEESEVRSFLQCLPYISHLRFKRFDSKQGEKEREERCRTFLLDLCLQAALHQPHNIQETVKKVMTIYYYYYEQSDFLLDLYSRVKQYESKTGRRVLPALLPVYQSVPAVWSINLSERKVSLLLEVLKLQTEKKPVELRDCSDEESEVRSFLQCLPYISHLRFNEFEQGEKEREERCRTFLLDVCLQAALHQPHNIQETVEKVMTIYYYEQSDFLLDLYSRVKQYESETGRRVLPALLPVYQSVPAVWSIKLSERKVSLLLEVLKLQTEKKPVELRDCSDEESEVRSFLQCLPYISHLRFYSDSESTASIQFLLNLSIAAVDCKSDKGESFTELLASVCSYNTFPFDEEYGLQERQSDFLLDLYSRVKQYESETGRRVLPALLPVYQSGPAVWYINLSERKVSLLLEVLKLQTKKKPVELRDCSDEESEVRSFLQCLPYISKIRFKRFYSDSESTASIQFLLNLSIAAVDCKSDKGESFTELLASACSYNTFPFGEEYGFQEEQSDFLLDLYSRVKQYESETGRRVLPALLPVYQSVPAVWSINLSKRKVSLLLEVLKLQTKKKPVELRDCSDEESEVRSFLQCLPYISKIRFKRFDSKHGEKEREERCRTFLLDLCLQAALHQPHNIQETVEKVITFTEYRDYYYYYDIQSDFLLDLYSRVKQYESETGRRVLPALLPVYQSVPAVWSIKLSERKVSLLLEVLKLQTKKKPVVLRDCSDEESEVRSFLQCLPYISHLRFKRFDSKQGEKEREERCRTFLLDLCLQAALHQPHNIQETVQKVITFTEYRDYYYYYDIQSDFLLDLYSRVKQYESETGRRVLPALLPVYQSVPAVWSINLSERKVSLLLEVLKLQTEKKPVELRDCSDEESEVRSFLQCLPYISHLRFNVFDSKQGEKEREERCRTFLLDLCLQAALHQPHNIQETVEKVMTIYYYEQSDFLLDLYSRVKQYESETGRRVLPALLPVYQSGPAVWSIKLSERKVSLLLEVLKLQTEKKPVELRDCSDEESEVRSFLQCLPYISHLRFNVFDSIQEETEQNKRCRTFLLDLCLQAALHQPHNIQETVEKVMKDIEDEDCYEEQSDFLLDLYSRVKQYESETGRSVLPALLPVYQSFKFTRFKWFDSKQGEKEREESWRTFKLDLCLQAALHQPHNIQETVEKMMPDIEDVEDIEDEDNYYEEQSDFLLDLYSRVKQYESETGRRVLPALLPVYQSGPAVWSIDLSERKVSLLLEVLKLQKKKKPVELRDCSDEESEVRSFLQCLPYISHLRFKRVISSTIQFLLNLSIAAVDCKSDKGESFTELLASVCSYNTFPFGEEYDGFQEEQSDFLLDLYSCVKQYESETGRRVLPALLPVYQSVPAVWYIDLSERKVSLLLEVLKLQTEKKPVELRDWSDEESEVRSFLQCLPYISELRCGENIIPRLSKAVVDYTEDTELVRAFFAAMDFIFVIHWVLTTRECRAVRKVLSLSDSKLKLTLKPRAISLRGARLLFRHITHLQKLCLSDRVVGRMVRAFGAVRAGGSLVIEELCMSLNSIKPKKEIFTFLSSLSSLLNIWTVHCVNLTECRMEAHSLISLMCHAGNLKIRLSKETLQQFTSLLCEVQDGELTRFFLEKVGGDLTSCSLSWEELIHFLQQRVCRISANIRKSKITYNHIRQILPLLSEIQFKRLNPSVVLSIIREIYETGSAHCVSSLLSSTHSCINLNNTELDSYHCTALCFTLQHCTSVSLSLLWTSIPEGELVKILPLFNRVSQLSVDRVLLLKLLHCCSISELQQGAVAAVFSALQNRLDFSCSTGLDLSTETQDNTLHLTTEDCSDISTAIQKSLQLTELNLKDCEMEDTGVDMFFLILHTVKLCCSKTLLLRFLARLQVVNELDCVRHAMYLSQALDGEMDLSETPLDLPACRSLALFLEFSEGLSELDLSHCQLADHSLELLFPYLHKAAVLDLSHNGIDDCLAGRIYTVVSTSSNIQTVRLFNNRITDIEPFRKDKRFEVW